MDERRDNERYEFPLKIAVESVSDNESHFEETHLIDIGPGGACFSLKADVETGSIVAMTIPDIDDGFTRAIGLPSHCEGPLNIKLQGEVLRSEKVSAEAGERRVAVRFLGPVRLSFGSEPQAGGASRRRNLPEKHKGRTTPDDPAGSRRE